MNDSKSYCIAFVLGALHLTLGQAAADVNLGEHQASAQAYAIFGQPAPELTSATAMIDYVSSSAGLDSDYEQNNIDLTNNSHSLDPTSYSLLEAGVLPLRTNSTASELVVTIPMISSDGVSCFPVFENPGDATSGVTAFLSVQVTSGSTIVGQYVIKNDLNTGADLVSSGVTQSCPNNGTGPGSLTFDLSQEQTSTYDVVFNVGFEYDGARRVNNGSIEVFGDDGEPFTGTYTFTLDVSLSTGGSNHDNGPPCSGNCGVGVGRGGGNGTGNEGGGQGPPN